MQIPPRLLYTLLTVVAAWVLWAGTRNRPDPVWQYADQIVNSPCPMVNDVVDSVCSVYTEFHNRPLYLRNNILDSTGYNILAAPHLRTLSWDRFRSFFEFAKAERMVVLAGVTGTGSTKLAEKAAAFMCSNPDKNMLIIRCSPEFDLEYHKKYIGWEDENAVFQPGILLEFWDRCRQNPKQRFACVVDNFDKINPETFFGPELWEKLSSSNESAVLGGKNIDVPKNFYMFSVAHLGPGSRVEFNEEHYKRLGKQFIIAPNACELLDYFDKYALEALSNSKLDSVAKRIEVQALKTVSNRRRMVFFFLKANELMQKKYGVGYELGQGSNVRKKYLPTESDQLKETYIAHINSLARGKPLGKSDFSDIEYTIATGGLEPHTNFFDRQIQFLSETGYLVEITMVAATALLTTLIGYWIFRRREKMIRGYGEQVQEIFDAFELQTKSAEDASRELEMIKTTVNNQVLKRKLNYNEGLYFIAFVDDKARRIDFAKNVSENFLELFNAFMDDDVLTENEYQKLCQFLETMRHKIPVETYHSFIDKVEWAYKNSGEGK